MNPIKNAALYAVMVALVISVFTNYIFYNQVQDLNQRMSILQSQLAVQNTQVQQTPQAQTGTPYTFNTNNENTKTITAVAVRQVPTNDFFQSYTFEGTTMQITDRGREFLRSYDKLVNIMHTMGLDY